ncbi:glycosyltransferase family 61 protein [Methylobacterium nodulans]|uniref:Capsular polysaccharide biosynthesis protein-like protein n=1 Tax=Methylobacterium nodulans (strain LMG 21967 / CNCM I-2342 / ORS 2060) TaxID=460265 RepID=B8IAR2_METNO|nr:glycosyltransferase family 61 protein [Methylobacterium nodulans]ACL61107.1 Capsular polysaccharide biosynthesis protein-like protein [Methylobacterium nodulans ORS 2060]
MIDIPGACVLEMDCPNSYYSFPRLTELEAMPDHVRVLMNSIWSQAVHLGRKLRFFEHQNVFVTKEGLCFKNGLELIPETKTYHSDNDILLSREMISNCLQSGTAPSISKAILTKNRGAGNYGHFILEMLPRAWYARKYLGVTDWPALIHKTSPALSEIKVQALQASGFTPENIIATGDEPVFVERLIVVDGLAFHTQYLSPFVMTCLDEIAASVPPADIDRLYASRGRGASRDFVNEPAVADHLSKLGYINKFAGELSFTDQISVFHGCSSVVGVMGAALTNIVFCKPGTTVYCFMPSSACEVLFWRIAEARRLKYIEIRSREVGPQLGGLPWDRAVAVTSAELDEILQP